MRRDTQRRLMLLSALSCGVLVLIWIASVITYFGVEAVGYDANDMGTDRIAFRDGSVLIALSRRSTKPVGIYPYLAEPPMGLSFAARLRTAATGRVSRSGYIWPIATPLWPLILLTAAPWIAQWRRARRTSSGGFQVTVVAELVINPPPLPCRAIPREPVPKTPSEPPRPSAAIALRNEG